MATQVLNKQQFDAAAAAKKAKKDKTKAEADALAKLKAYRIPGATYSSNQGSFSQLLYATLIQIGNWDPKTIIIEKLPLDLYGRLSEIAQEFEETNDVTKKLLEDFFHQIVGSGEIDSALSNDQGANADISGDVGAKLTSTKGITVKGSKASADQIKNIEISLGVAHKLKAGPLATKAMLCAGIGESEFKAVMNGGGSPYGGVFQGNVRDGTWDVNDTAGMAKCFLLGGKGFQGGGAIKLAKQKMSPGLIAVTVEGSGSNNFGHWGSGENYYGHWGPEADKIMAAASNTSSTTTDVNAGVNDTTSGTAGTTGDPEDASADETKPGTGASSTSTASSNKEVQKLLKPVDLDGAMEGLGPMINLAKSMSRANNFTGKNSHGKMTSTGNVSEHWYGMAMDFAVLGVQQSTPGLENFYQFVIKKLMPMTHQVIWQHTLWNDGQKQTYPGTDHMNHVHVSLKEKYAKDKNLVAQNIVKALNGQPLGEAADADSDTTVNNDGVASIANGSDAGAFALAAQLNLPGTMNREEAGLLTGDKALMNDVTLFPFVAQLCESSMRSFQSLPDGKFYAFYPDYFGEFFHRDPYWEIRNIEILDGKINVSDERLITHMYVVGSMGPTSDPLFSKLNTAGVVTIYNAFLTNEMLTKDSDQPEDDGKKKSKKNKGTGAQKAKDAKAKDVKSYAPAAPFGKGIMQDKIQAGKFLERYGARVEVNDNQFIWNRYFELFSAYQKFMLAWSRQFLTEFTFTFMPELYPGGKVAFPDHGIQMYIEEVTHEFDYEGGFTTSANLSAPAVMGKPDANGNYAQTNPALPPNMARALVAPLGDTDASQKDDE